MSILLVTGRPGAGKTLWTVAHIVDKLPGWLEAGRPVFSDINGLDIEGVQRLPDEVREWPSFPDKSVLIFDEVQRSFPPRNTQASVPLWISEWETHRHRGIDAIFITQGPRLIDRHLHDLVDNHVHLYRPFGWERARVFRWQGVNLTPDPEQTRATAEVETFRYPKHLFAVYRSAQEHFVKPRVPWAKLAGLAVGLVLAIGGFWWGLSPFYRPAAADPVSDSALPSPAVPVCLFSVGGESFDANRMRCSVEQLP